MMLRMFVSALDSPLICGDGGGRGKFSTGLIKYREWSLPEKVLNFPTYLKYIWGSTPQTHHNFLPFMSFYSDIILQALMNNNLWKIQNPSFAWGIFDLIIKRFFGRSRPFDTSYHKTITYFIPNLWLLTEKCLYNQLMIWKIQQRSWIWN